MWRTFKKSFFWKCFTNADEIYDYYLEFVKDPRYGAYFGRKIDEWMPLFNNFVSSVETSGVLPPAGSKMRRWFDRQVRECKASNPLYPPEAVAAWEEFVASPLYDQIDSSDEEEA